MTLHEPLPPSTQRSQTKMFVFAVAAIVLGVGGLLAFRMWKASPTYAFLQIKNSLENHDKELFHEFVDLDSVLSRGVDAFLVYASKDDELDGNPFAGIAQGLAELMKPQLIEMSRAAIEKEIESAPARAKEASAKGRENEKTGPAEILAKVRRSARIGWKKSSGKLTTVALVFTHEQYGSEHEIQLAMRKVDGHLQIIEVANLTDFLHAMDAAEMAWKRRKNEPIRSKLSGLVEAGKVQVLRDTGRWGWERNLFLGIQMTVGKEKLTRFSGNLHFNDAQGNHAFSVPIAIEGEIASGTANEFTYRKGINQFVDEELRMWNADYDSLVPHLDLHSVRLADGTDITLPYPHVE